MLNKREKILANILAWMIIFAFFWLYYSFNYSDNAKIKEEILKLEQRINESPDKLPNTEELIARQDILRNKLEEYKNKFYTTGEIDLNTFSTLIWNKLVDEGISIEQFAPADSSSGLYSEFTVKADAVNFLSFLKKVYEGDKYWDISFLSIKSAGSGGNIEVNFKIGYEIINKTDN